MNSLAERYQEVKQRIQQAAQSVGRDPSGVELIVVTKNHPVELVAALHGLGHRQFGENRDQEARPKAQTLAALGIQDATWHFVGQLQSNKVKSVLDYASVIHSIDRPSLVTELEKQLTKRHARVSGFLELNLTDDENRGGVRSENLLELAERVLSTGRIELLGVMAVASLGADPRADFERTIQASLQLQSVAPSAKGLSMGMSEDFEIAIELGATHIRVGSAITGPRPTSA